MKILILEWQQGDRIHSQKLFAEESTVKVIIGRDKKSCDLIIDDDTNTVSRIHAEIIKEKYQEKFYLLNRTRVRTKPNPIYVDGEKIIHQLAPLKIGSEICLGKVKLTVKAIESKEKSVLNSGLKCHVCGKVSNHSDLDLVCRWCGTSLASAVSIYQE